MSKCKCCTLDLEVLDKYELCHYCYFRCQEVLKQCENYKSIVLTK